MTDNPVIDICGCCGLSFIIALFLLAGIPAIISLLTPKSVKDRERKIAEANRKRWHDKIKELESKARQGDLIALQQWKEMTSREEKSESWFFIWWS